jgi:agmatine deiminase
MGATIDSTPAADRWRMPAEWEPHAGCWIAWPERPDNWREAAAPAQEAFAAVASAISAAEPVTVGASDAQFERARAMLPPQVRVLELSTDDAWMRDIGPSFLTGRASELPQALRGVDWRFNAWGGLYEDWRRDERAAAKVLEVEGAGRYRAPIVLEGGSIHVDGEGTVLTTEECLLNENRNPGLSREQIERALCDYLGATKVIWLGRGVPCDETDGHVDNLACFVRPGTVLVAVSQDREDPMHAVGEDARRRLAEARDAAGRALEVLTVPTPRPPAITPEEATGVTPVPGTHPRRPGDRLAASYVNFYPANGRIVFPLLDERCDEQAAEVLASCFPDREIVGIQAREILLGGGNIHCITQQVPARAGTT